VRKLLHTVYLLYAICLMLYNYSLARKHLYLGLGYLGVYFRSIFQLELGLGY